MSSNIERLGNTLAGRMSRTAKDAKGVVVELGTITETLALIVDSIKTPIPKGSYMVSMTIASDTYRSEVTTHSHDQGEHNHSGGSHGGHTGGDGSHSHSGGTHTHVGGSHDHRLPAAFRGLQGGDRVLVVWCGNEPVVVSVVTSS